MNVQAQTTARIGISIDESKPKMYHFQGNKGIVIHDQPWKELIIIVQIDKIGAFSSVKIILETIKTQHKSSRQSAISLRPNIKG